LAYTQAPYDESVLVPLLQQGDKGAFAAIYDYYWQPLIDFAYKRLKSLEDSEEVVQEVFINLFERRTTLEIHTSLNSYLKTAVRYKVYNKYREWLSNKQQHRIAHLEDVAELPGIDTLEYKELNEKLHESINKLPEKCREVFILSREEKLSNKAIADRLGISINTVEKHIGKALQILRNDLHQYNMDLIIVAVVVGMNV